MVQLQVRRGKMLPDDSWNTELQQLLTQVIPSAFMPLTTIDVDVQFSAVQGRREYDAAI